MNNERKRLIFAATTLIVTSTLLLFFLGCSNKSGSAVNVGAVLPLTGNIAQYGNWMKQGMELALQDAIDSGKIKQKQVGLIIEDGELNPTKSVNAFNKLLQNDHIAAVVPATSGIILAIKPLANRGHVVLLNASAISTEIEDADDFCFSVLPSANLEGAFLAEFAYNDLAKRNAGVLYRNDPSGRSFLDAIKARFKALGGNVLYEESNEPNETDFRPQIAKIASIDSMDVLFVASFGPEVATYARQAVETGVNKQILTYETFNSPKALEIAGSASERVIFCAPGFDPNSDDFRTKEFVARVKRAFGQIEVNYYIASHYDAMMILIEAISAGNSNGDALRNYIRSLSTYNGISGRITFDSTGASTIPLEIYTVREGLVVKYK